MFSRKFSKEEDYRRSHIIPSLFPLTPSVKFSLPTTPSKLHLHHLREKDELSTKIGKWVKSETCDFLNKIVSASGFKLIPFQSDEHNWQGFINHGTYRRDPARDPRAIIQNRFQKYNIMPGSEILCNKVPFTALYRKYQQHFGSEEFGFSFESWILPDEFDELKQMFHANPRRYFIYKPSDGHNCIGVKVIKTKDLEHLGDINTPAVAQILLHPPLLLDGVKAELRCYATVTSSRPLRIFLYMDGIVKTFTNFLDNFDQSLASSETNVPVIQKDGFWMQDYFLSRLGALGYPTDTLKSELEHIMIKALLMGEEGIAEQCKKWLIAKSNAHQFWSFDFIFDEKVKPYLIEMNRFQNLDFTKKHPYELFKQKHLVDMLNLVGYKNYSVNVPTIPQNPIALDDELLRIVENMELNEEQILDLMEGEDEINRNVGFKRIFPTSQTSKYFKYLMTPDMQEYHLQARWEELFENRRTDGIAILNHLFKKHIFSKKRTN